MHRMQYGRNFQGGRRKSTGNREIGRECDRGVPRRDCTAGSLCLTRVITPKVAALKSSTRIPFVIPVQ